MRIGYFLSTEEYGPAELVAQARAAEEAGFQALWISDHFHPWNNEQGNSPLVWSVIGAISQVCNLHVTTAVTCPTTRVHPAIVAQAAGTCAELLEGRFTLGVGTGEALNESIMGGPWPTLDVRLEMLEEAVGLIRELWKGEVVSHRGRHYTVDHARIYNVPDVPPEIFVSGFGPKAIDVAARIGDGYIGTSPDPELLGRFRAAADGLPRAGRRQGRLRTHQGRGLGARAPAVAERRAAGRARADPADARALRAGDRAGDDGLDARLGRRRRRPRGPPRPDPQYADAGYDELYLANMGPHYLEMIEFYGQHVLPKVS